MSTLAPGRRFCAFEPRSRGVYICELDQICCKTGCCPNITHNYINTWYFWVGVTLIIFFFYALAEYCKRMEKTRLRRLTHRLAPNRRLVRQLRTPQLNVDNFLDRLIQSYSNPTPVQTRLERPAEPPSYNEALGMPRPSKKRDYVTVEVHRNADNRKREEILVPSYDEALHIDDNITDNNNK